MPNTTDALIQRLKELPRAVTGLAWINRQGVIHKDARLNEIPVADLRALAAELEQTRRKVERYEKALEHYADESSWNTTPIKVHPLPPGLAYKGPENKGWKLAQAALNGGEDD